MASAVASSSTFPVMTMEKRPSNHKGRHRHEKSSSDSHRHRSTSKERHKSRSKRDTTSTSDKDGKDALKRKKVSGPKESAFRYLYPSIDISIPPALIHDPHRAADELMDTLLMRYVPQMSGVLLSHHNITFLRQHAKIDSDGAYAIVPAGMTCLVWAPEIGMRLEGRIQLSTPSHISLLVHGIFNASITSAHLPSTMEINHSSKDTVYNWHEFQSGEHDIKMEDAQGSEGDIFADDGGEKSTGYWVSKDTGERLGGKDGKVVFTVVGMTVANHMLSIFGSLLRKPFSIAAPTYISKPSTTLISLDRARKVHFEEERQNELNAIKHVEEEEDDRSDDDEIPTSNIVERPQVIAQEKKKKRSKVGPRREGQLSGSESEGEAKREKKKRKTKE